MWDATFRRLAGRYNAPPTAPASISRWRIDIPDDPQFLAAISELIEQMGIPDVWRESVGSLTQLEAATIANRMYMTFRKDDTMLGVIVPFATDTLPATMLLCDGSTYDAGDYPELYAVINPALKLVGDQFQTPDLRGKFVFAAGHVDYAEYSTGGEFVHILTEPELAFHQHTTAPHSHIYTVTTSTASAGGEIPAIATFSVETPSVTADSLPLTDAGAGADEPHENMPPFYVLRYGMIAKVG